MSLPQNTALCIRDIAPWLWHESTTKYCTVYTWHCTLTLTWVYLKVLHCVYVTLHLDSDMSLPQSTALCIRDIAPWLWHESTSKYCTVYTWHCTLILTWVYHKVLHCVYVTLHPHPDMSLPQSTALCIRDIAPWHESTTKYCTVYTWHCTLTWVYHKVLHCVYVTLWPWHESTTKYCTVYTWHCTLTLTWVYHKVLHCVYVTLHPDMSLPQNTALCIHDIAPWHESTTKYCTVYTWHCTLTLTWVYLKVLHCVYVTLHLDSDMSLPQSTALCIRDIAPSPWHESTTKYCTVYTWHCTLTLTWVYHKVLHCVYVTLHPDSDMSLPQSTALCICDIAPWHESTTKYCTVYTWHCTLTLTWVYHKVLHCVYVTLHPDMSLPQSTALCIHDIAPWHESTTKYCTVYTWHCTLTLTWVYHKVLHCVYVTLHPDPDMSLPQSTALCIRDIAPWPWHESTTKYCTVYTWHCTLTWVYHKVLHCVYMTLHPDMSLPQSTALCIRNTAHWPWHESTTKYCTVYTWHCTLTLTWVYHKVLHCVYVTLHPDMSLPQNTALCIHDIAPWHESTTKYCTVYTWHCTLTLTWVYHKVLHCVYVTLHPDSDMSLPQSTALCIRDIAPWLWHESTTKYCTVYTWHCTLTLTWVYHKVLHCVYVTLHPDSDMSLPQRDVQHYRRLVIPLLWTCLWYQVIWGKTSCINDRKRILLIYRYIHYRYINWYTQSHYRYIHYVSSIWKAGCYSY